MRELPLATVRASDREWPIGTLDLATESAAGWRPKPFRQFVVKVHSRCNLSCNYCYVYHQADQSWREQPVTMSHATVAAAANRVADHARRHQLHDLQIVLHGGEPLLAGVDLLEFLVATFRGAVPAGTDVTFNLQTNGLLLDEPLLDLFAARGVRVGVSLDGSREAHNRRRTFRNGSESLTGTRSGLRLLTSDRFRSVFAGLLAVVDLASDPVEVYESLLDWGPPALDFLLPHGNWEARPPGRPEDEESTPYADWLAALFDRWYDADPHETDIRFFQEIMALLLGGHSQVETIGLTPSTLLVIETDGSIEQVDALKSAYPGAAATGLHVLRNDFDDAFRQPGILARQIGPLALSDECQECQIHHICGGGYYPHRYRSGSGFRNRSVYCPDLFALVLHIGSRLRADLKTARPAVR